MFTTLIQTFVLLLTATAALAAPAGRHHKWPRFTVPQQHFEVLSMRSQEPVNPAAMLEATCIDRNAHIVFHDQNAAELAICGGISGDVAACQGSPATTVGRAGSARFALKTTVEGASINIAKAKWEQCVRAARDKCPTGSVRAVCAGGATSGDVEFTLDNSQSPSGEL
ncbi:hypothetical protein ColTof4_07895 [Colletotrichum tofieldiae]|uniref:Uncharacterized protein n=2 Tax=Colletotrichum spaethianum species complex TaxID=2707349 RepID=A0A166QQ64_9PEZI|nr:hypothetical protein CT0861_08564 [Colletotrichum tofieldiae]GJC83994.1 hypothetical protein ColLi_06832 [Colletotrichum liriopes]GKT55240.1 hypothetical protein ColTof3_02579 [Colletotrichum tofieldiae]GKT75472.1 hypothetical protein ColTof4_07895 [Colletotrichum tofieldiae]GKT83139.1 hypothetical protein Ct61P_00989 [Colletotrichum tofieldiae]